MSTLLATVVRSGLTILFLVIPALFPVAVKADTVDLTDGPAFTFRHGSDLFVQFSIWNYGVNNQGSSPYPTSVGLQLLGVQPSSAALRRVPGSSDTYFGGYLMQGWLENMDGTASVSFTSSDATRLGLASGALLLQPGQYGNSGAPVALIEANAALTLSLSERIFGPDVATRGSSAIIHLRNLGSDLEIGLSGGSSVLSAIREPSISGFGPMQTSGITQALSITAVPEPGSLWLLALALGTLSGWCVKRSRRAQRAPQ